MDYKKLKKQGHLLKPLINIGKNGLTPALILEIKNTLKKKKLLKIKINKSALDKKDKHEVINKILLESDADLISFVGFNAVIYKK